MTNLENILSHSDCLSQEQMQLYLENKLDQEQTHDVESHIADCMFCSDALEGLQSIAPELVQENVEDLKSHFEALLAKDDETSVPIIKKEPQPLQARKGGRRISWKAAAGLFLLIFGGGLVVFSYIKDSTNWFGNQHKQYSKNEKSKDFESEEMKVTTPELETVIIDANALPTNINKEPAKENKKLEKKAKKQDYKISKPTNRELVAKNEASMDRKERDLSPPAPKKAVELANAQPGRYQSSPSVVSKDKGKERAKENKRLAKVEEGYIQSEDNLSMQNTYSQPKYDGKLKNTKQIGDVNNEKAKQKVTSQKVTIAGGRSDETVYVIDGIQSKSLKKGAYYGNLDNYAKGNNAYNKGDYKQSIRYYKRALRKKSLKNRDEVLFKLAMAYEKTNNQPKAESIYEELEKKAPFQSRALNGLKRVRSVK